MNNNTVKKWKPTKLLDSAKTVEHEALIAFALEYIASKLIASYSADKDLFNRLSLPVVVHIYNMDSEIFIKTPVPVLWIVMKKVYNQLDFSELSVYEASDVEYNYVKQWAEKIYKELISRL